MTTGNRALTQFTDRREAGRILSRALQHYTSRSNVIVLGLSRGGVPVAFEIARNLGAPLDVFLVRKLHVPAQPELAMGALASGGTLVLDHNVISWAGVTQQEIDAARTRAARELTEQEQRFRSGRPALDIRGKTVILVDDGLATGSTMRAAATAIRQRHPGRLVVAVPVAALESVEAVDLVADEVVCLRMPAPFTAVSEWYADFTQLSEEDVATLLHDARPVPIGAGDQEC